MKNLWMTCRGIICSYIKIDKRLQSLLICSLFSLLLYVLRYTFQYSVCNYDTDVISVQRSCSDLKALSGLRTCSSSSYYDLSERLRGESYSLFKNLQWCRYLCRLAAEISEGIITHSCKESGPIFYSTLFETFTYHNWNSKSITHIAALLNLFK